MVGVHGILQPALTDTFGYLKKESATRETA